MSFETLTIVIGSVLTGVWMVITSRAERKFKRRLPSLLDATLSERGFRLRSWKFENRRHLPIAERKWFDDGIARVVAAEAEDDSGSVKRVLFLFVESEWHGYHRQPQLHSVEWPAA